MSWPFSARRKPALFEPLPLDGGGVGERVKIETRGVFDADPLSAGKEPKCLGGHGWPAEARRAGPGRSPSASKAMDGRERPRADLSHKGRGLRLKVRANWVSARDP
jgi:hypothetical protein